MVGALLDREHAVAAPLVHDEDVGAGGADDEHDDERDGEHHRRDDRMPAVVEADLADAAVIHPAKRVLSDDHVPAWPQVWDRDESFAARKSCTPPSTKPLAGGPETHEPRVGGMRAPGLTAAPLVIAGLGRVRERLDRAARN